MILALFELEYGVQKVRLCSEDQFLSVQRLRGLGFVDWGICP